MSLAAWQHALYRLVSERDATIADLDLTAPERAWLTAAAGSRGLAMTRELRRAWRRMRLRQTLRLSVHVLSRDELRAHIDAYVDATECRSFFDVPEACGFLDFLDGRVPERSRSVCRFERGLLAAAAQAAFADPPPVDGARLGWLPGAALVTFAAPFEEVLTAAITGAPPPDGGEPSTVLIAPDLPRHHRAITAAELAVADAARVPAPASALAGDDPAHRAAVAELVRVRFLGCGRPRTSTTGPTS